MTKNKIDFVILGGGCAALSLIDNVIKNKIRNYSFLVIEKRKKYIDDKSWCFWDSENSEFNNLANKSWNSFSFGVEENNNVISSKSYRYYYIKSINFYNSIRKKILKSPNIQLNLNEDILFVKPSNEYFLINTNKNKYIAKNVLDTRARLDVFQKFPFMYQSFLGYEIELKKYNSIEINQAHIMKKMGSTKDYFYFDYILPIKKNIYLFEFTVFSKKLLTTNYFKKNILSRIKSYYSGHFKIIRKEFGIIPMGFVDNKKIIHSKKFCYAGTVAGAVRPSSGYAFLRIQKWAKKCALNIDKNGSLLHPEKDSFLLSTLDKLLLIVLCNNTNYAPKIFFQFSKNISSNAFVKFMSGNANIFDYVKVILAMPKFIFLKCLLSK